MNSAFAPRSLTELKSYITEHKPRQQNNILAFGQPAIDAKLPGSGLALGALHEVAGTGADTEHAAAATLWAGGVVSRMAGDILWVTGSRDLFSPALAAIGLPPDRLLITEAGRQVLLVMEEGLRHAGLAAVVGEVSGRLSLTASRRLQLAAEQSGVTALVVRRSRRFDDPALLEPNAALTRWRIACLPSPPPLAHAPQTQGVGPPLWRLDLIRCRGGEAASWIVEGCDAQGYLHLAQELGHRSAAPPARRQAAAG